MTGKIAADSLTAFNGSPEAASSFELGNVATNYTTPFAGIGPAAPYNALGLESNNGTGLGGEGYQLLSPDQLTPSLRQLLPFILCW